MDPVTTAQYVALKDSFTRQRDAAHPDGIDIEIAYTPAGELDYIYEVGRLLTVDRAGNVDQVERAMKRGLGRDPDEEQQVRVLERAPDNEQPGVGDLVTLTINPDAAGGQMTVPEALDRMDEGLRQDNQALRIEDLVTPVYVVHITKICPGVEPEVPSGYPIQPWPAQSTAGPAQRDVKIGVSDTGLQPGYDDAIRYPWLAGVDGIEEQRGPTLPNGLQSIPQYAGHGTFVAGVAKCMAPTAAVFVNDHFTMSGGELEYVIIQKLEELIQNQSPDLISLSAGTYTHRGWDSLAFSHFHERNPDITLVAAAGNDSTNRPFYPAAFDWVTGVGALGTDQRHRAWFSNHGDWVDVYALGEGMVNAYATGEYTYREPPKKPAKQTFNGMARWDGTSFSTPLVAGLIADEMARRGVDAQTAKQTVLGQAKEDRGISPVPGVVDRLLHAPQAGPIANG
jgi:subtilisin family serine protease